MFDKVTSHFLEVDPDLLDKWKERYSKLKPDRLNIGISWQGGLDSVRQNR